MFRSSQVLYLMKANPKTFIILSVIVGVLGVMALISAWVVGAARIYDYQARLFEYAQTLFLLAIWLHLGAIYHQNR
jgi:hypothetical protein